MSEHGSDRVESGVVSVMVASNWMLYVCTTVTAGVRWKSTIEAIDMFDCRDQHW